MTADPLLLDGGVAREGFESGLVSLLRHGEPEGAGMLVDGSHVVTCTHVWDDVRSGEGTAEIAFPYAGSARRVVELERARPVDAVHGDVALLRLREPPPAPARPVRLLECPELHGHRFEVWGFPRAQAGEQLAHGVLSRRRGDGLVQLEGDTVPGLAVVPGFSGAPVWDVALEAVVGILTSVDPDRQTKTGYLIPVDVIAQLWPGLPRHRRPPRTERRIIGVRPAVAPRQWYDREDLRRRLVERVRDRAPVTQVVGRRGVGKSGVVTRVLTSDEDAGALVDAVVFLSTRTGAGEVTLGRIVHALAALLPGPDEQRLLARWSGVGPAVLPDLFDALRDRTVAVVLDNLDDLQVRATGWLLAEDLVTFLHAVVSHERPPVVLTTSQLPLGVPPDVRTRLQPPLRMTEGLPADQSVAMLRELDADGAAGLAGLDDATLEDLAERVGGLPRGLQLLLGYLLDHAASGVRRVLRSDRAPADVLDELVSVAYDRLTGTDREVVEVLAVAGAPLSCGELAELVQPADRDAVEDTLDDLTRRQELAHGDDESIYRLHPLDTDHVRRCLDPVRATELHLRLADWYRSRTPPPAEWRSVTDADPAVRQYRHLWAGGERERALDLLAGTAEFLARRGAIALLRTAVADAEAAGRGGALPVVVCRGFADLSGGSRLSAAEHFATAARLDPATPAWSLWQGVALRHAGRAADAVRVLAPLQDGVPRPVLLAAGLEFGLTLCYLGRLGEARATAARLAALVTDEDPPEVRGYATDIVALAALTAGRYDEVLATADAAMAAYASDAVHDSAEYVRNVRGLALLALGALDEAVAALTTVRETGHLLGNDRLEGIAAVNLAWALLLQGSTAEAAVTADQAARCLADSRTDGKDGASALARAARGGDVREELRRAADALRVNPDFHQADADQIDRLSAALAATGRRPDGGT